MFEHETESEKALAFSRFDTSTWLSPSSLHSFELDDFTWPTAEHYFQANMVAKQTARDKILQAPTGKQAHEIGSPWYRSKRKDWKKVRKTLMTRALYTKAMTHADVKKALLATGDQKIVETSMYDHYWGLARDQRGENTLGVVWMNIREKIRTDEDARVSASDANASTPSGTVSHG